MMKLGKKSTYTTKNFWNFVRVFGEQKSLLESQNAPRMWTWSKEDSTDYIGETTGKSQELMQTVLTLESFKTSQQFILPMFQGLCQKAFHSSVWLRVQVAVIWRMLWIDMLDTARKSLGNREVWKKRREMRF